MRAPQRKRRPDAGTSEAAGRGDQEEQQDYGQAGRKASTVDEPYQPFPWFKLDSSDWLASTRGLSLAEAGALITLRAMIHERGEPLPEDYGRLGRQCGAPSAKAFERIVDTLVVAKLLFREGGGLWCRDIAEQIDHQRGVSRAAKENRSKVGKKTKQNQSKASTGVRRFKSKMGDEDKEGDIPSGDIPHSHISSSDIDDDRSYTDAHPTGASDDEGPILTTGDPVEVGVCGICTVVGFGLVGKSRWIKASRKGDDRPIFVPVSDQGHLMVNDAVFKGEFVDTHGGKDVQWVDPIDCSIPRVSGRMAHDAA